MSPLVLVVANVVVALGSALQGTIGFGLGLLAAPILLLLEPRLVPGPLLAVSAVLTLLMSVRERDGIAPSELAWSLGGRILGIGLAVILLSRIPDHLIEELLGGLILVAAVLTASGWHFRPSPRTLFGAGALSGIMGTTTSVGGPPMALLYQHESGPRIRGTLSAYFVIGGLMSLVALTRVGRFGSVEVGLSLGLVPSTLAGFWLSRYTVRVADRGPLRITVLVVSGLAGLVVLAKGLF